MLEKISQMHETI